MILEPVTASAKRSASLPAQRPTPRSVSPCPSLQYPSFQFFKPPKPLELAPSALSLATAATEHGKLGACACPSSRLPDPVPLPLTHPTPRFAPAAPLFAPVLPALESKFQFLKSPTRREGGNRDRRDLQELERHVLELVEGQRGLRRELRPRSSKQQLKVVSWSQCVRMLGVQSCHQHAVRMFLCLCRSVMGSQLRRLEHDQGVDLG